MTDTPRQDPTVSRRPPRRVPRIALALVAALLLTFAIAALTVLRSGGRLEYHTFASATLGRDYGYNIYLPEGYGRDGLVYPVLYLLHASFGSAGEWPEHGRAKQAADRLIAAGGMPPAVIVMPGSRSWWVDGANEPARTAFFQDLIPHVESRWSVIAAREGRAVAGASAGGYGTVNFALERPDVFAAAAALSPSVYVPLPPGNSSALRHPAYAGPDGAFDPAIWRALNYPVHLPGYRESGHVVPMLVTAGTRDRYDIAPHARALVEALSAHQPGAVAFHLTDDGHTWEYWREVLPSALAFVFAHTAQPRAAATVE